MPPKKSSPVRRAKTGSPKRSPRLRRTRTRRASMRGGGKGDTYLSSTGADAVSFPKERKYMKNALKSMTDFYGKGMEDFLNDAVEDIDKFDKIYDTYEGMEKTDPNYDGLRWHRFYIKSMKTGLAEMKSSLQETLQFLKDRGVADKFKEEYKEIKKIREDIIEKIKNHPKAEILKKRLDING